jgi:hypothetical protein
MNRYSLDSDSRRWWWPSAAAGAIGTAAVTALFVLPASQVDAVPAPEPAGTTTSVDRPCFIFQSHWNTALDGPQPVCTTQVSTPPETSKMRAPGRPVLRPGLGYLP